MATETIGVGILGLGFMGRTHLTAYTAAAAAGLPCRLVAVADADPARLTGRSAEGGNIDTGAADQLFDPAQVRTYTDHHELLADPAVSLVSICTYTDTHPDLTIAALRAGKHVIVEKPLAVDPADADRVVAAAAEASTLCMPAMCMRFWPAWSWLKEQVEAGTYGKVRSAVFQRLGAPPAWARDFYTNAARSGGALVDLHIHDADFIRWVFGEPESVSSTGDLSHLTTCYEYGQRGPSHVIAEGGWDHDPGFGFRMKFVVIFDEATAEYDLGKNPQLIVHRAGESTAVRVEPISGYDGEIRHIVSAIAEGRRQLKATVAEAAAAVRMLADERRSLEQGIRCPGPWGV